MAARRGTPAAKSTRAKSKARRAAAKPKRAAKARAKPKGKKAPKKLDAEQRLAKRIGLPREARIVEPVAFDSDVLSIVIEAAPEASPAGLRQHLERVYGTVVLSRLFPDFRAGEDIPSLRNYYVAVLPTIPLSRLMVNPHDVGYAALQKGVVASAQPNIPPPPTTSMLCQDPDAESHSNRRWSLDQMRVPQAWQKLADAGMNRGGGITIGQPDTGMTTHAQLFRQTSPMGGFDCIRGTAPGIDPLPVLNISRAEFFAHGTQTASIIAADPLGDGAFMTGIAPDVTLLPFRVSRSVVVASPSILAQGIDRANRSGCDIISISLGGVVLWGVWAAIRNAYAHDRLICCAAGQCEPLTVAPAIYPESIACAGSRLRTDGSGGIHEAPWKPTCRGKVEIAASAEKVWNCVPPIATPDGSFEMDSEGTSFAAPAVAAIGALWLQFHKNDKLKTRWTRFMALNRVFKRMLKDTARRPAGWPGHGWGPGIIDAGALLDAELLPTGIPTSQAQFLMMNDQPDLQALFEGIFWDQPAAAVQAVLARMLGAANPTQLRNALHQFGGELTGLLQQAQENFDQVRDAVAAEARGEADRAAAAARSLAQNASDRLRSVFG